MKVSIQKNIKQPGIKKILTFKNITNKLTNVENFLILFVLFPSNGVVSPQSIKLPNTQKISKTNDKNKKNTSLEKFEFLRFFVSNPNATRPKIS